MTTKLRSRLFASALALLLAAGAGPALAGKGGNGNGSGNPNGGNAPGNSGSNGNSGSTSNGNGGSSSNGNGTGGSNGNGSGGGAGSNGGGSVGPQVVAPGACAISDIVAAPNGSACSGFLAGNALGGNPGDVLLQTSALNSLGLAGTATQLEHINLTSSLIDFTTTLYGETYLGVHWGAGVGGPGVGVKGGVTGFYRLNFGANAAIGQLFSTFQATNSAAVLFATQAAPPPILPPPPPPLIPPPPPAPPTELPYYPPTEQGPISVAAIPEPTTWAMMILGFGFVGALLRRRRLVLA